MYFFPMEATLTELARHTRAVVRPVIRHGNEVILTEFGKPVAKIVPYIPTITVLPTEALSSGELTDQAIIEAVRESREDYIEQRDQ
jgi:antitoxin (DNA-binding transcriptional repressor) of toxin-antitoxin stability system